MSQVLSIQIHGMSCEHCLRAVEQALVLNPGVKGVRVTLGGAEVVFDPQSVTKSELFEAIRAAGPYDIGGFSVDG